MKKSILTIAILLCAVLYTDAFAQKFPDMDKSPMDVASYPSHWRRSDKVIRITYSRPQLKGRPLDSLARLNKKWRTGANETTEVTFYRDVTFGGKPVKAGTYSLYTIPGKKEWTIALSTQLNVWGAYFHKDENDVVRVTAPVKKSKTSVEEFAIAIDDNMTIHMGWGNVIVSVDVD